MDPLAQESLSQYQLEISSVTSKLSSVSQDIKQLCELFREHGLTPVYSIVVEIQTLEKEKLQLVSLIFNWSIHSSTIHIFIYPSPSIHPVIQYAYNASILTSICPPIDTSIHLSMHPYIHSSIYPWMYECMNRWIDGKNRCMYGWIDGCTDA